MKKFILLILMILLLLSAFIGCKKKSSGMESNQSVQSPKPSDEPVINPEAENKLKILYAGLPGTERAKDFMDFLSRYFTEVKFTDYNKFTGDLTKGYDVVILDHDGSATSAPTPNIKNSYSKATVTMGVPGADISTRLSLKTGYL